MKNHIISGLIAMGVSIGTLWWSPQWMGPHKTLKIEHVNKTPVRGALYTVDENDEVVPLDFTKVSEEVMDAVVHIKSTQTSPVASMRSPNNRRGQDAFKDFFGADPFERFFGPQYRRQQSPGRSQPKVGSGSGVIINQDGYIITNNHVIADADEIEVTLHDNRSFKATLVGADPSTDLALLQIMEKNLRALPLVNSDEVKVGEWVLAVGNPFNLNSTVTAGIVSAKSRSINILRDQYAVESFIQTDAAINPGNSGGALVNLQGSLVGINTAIASPTGSYTGYGFAVPANIVSKVTEDLLKYGFVQRGYLGVTIRGVDGNLAKEKSLSVTNGVYVDSLANNSAAKDAGLKKGDVILKVDDNKVDTAPELQEIIARHRPGDDVNISIKRGSKDMNLKVRLKNREGDTEFLAKSESEVLSSLGAAFEEVDKDILKKMGLKGGIRVKKIYPGKLRRETDMQEGFIITKVDKKDVRNKKELIKAMEDAKGGVLIEGHYEDLPGAKFYALGF